MYKFIALSGIAAVNAGSPISVSMDTDLRGGSMTNFAGSWKHSYQGVNLAAEYDRSENEGFLHKLRAGRNLFDANGAKLDADVTYNFASHSVGVNARADVQGLHLNIDHDMADHGTSVEASYNVQDTDLSAEFDSSSGFKSVAASKSFDVAGNSLNVSPRFEMGGKLLKSKLRYGLSHNSHLQADVSYGMDDKAASVTAEYGTGLDNGDFLTVALNPEANQVSATLESKMGGGADDPSWEIAAAADYSKGAGMLDSMSLNAKRSWSF